MIRATYLTAAAFLCSAMAHASPLPMPVDFITGAVPTGPGSTFTFDVTLPVLLGGNADVVFPDFAGDLLFLKFKIPSISQITSINSFLVNIMVIDDESDAGETAEIAFALPGGNLILDSAPFTRLTGPVTLSYLLTPAQIAQVFPTITDGNFRLRVMRQTGDFDVVAASASIDANLAPEPATGWFAVAGMLACGIFSFQRRSASAARR